MTLTDDIGDAADATDTERERYRDPLRPSTRYEYRFRDAAWRQEASEL